MKKMVLKTKNKVAKKESEFEMLARIVGSGFERLQTEMKERFEGVNKRFELIDSQLFSINHELKDHTQRLDRIERKQNGVRESLDNVVYKSEFKALAHKVDMLERRVSKK